MSQLLTVEGVGVKFDDHEVLRNVSFDLRREEVLAIVGPNGAGKSVLFRALLGLIPYSGRIHWQPNLKANYIPQRFSIDRDFPLTVKEFFELKTKNIKRVLSSLASVGLDDEHHIREHILNERLGWLSGGQLQRVLIAWAVVDDPDVILFDEPTAGIDVGGEETIYNLLKKLNHDHGLTIILISHDLNIVYKYANKVICLNKDMICYGLPQEVLDPQALAKLYGGETAFYHHEH